MLNYTVGYHHLAMLTDNRRQLGSFLSNFGSSSKDYKNVSVKVISCSTHFSKMLCIIIIMFTDVAMAGYQLLLN